MQFSLTHTAKWPSSPPQRIATHRNARQRISLHRSASLCTAMHRSAPERTGIHRKYARPAHLKTLFRRDICILPSTSGWRNMRANMRSALGRLVRALDTRTPSHRARRRGGTATASTVIYGRSRVSKRGLTAGPRAAILAQIDPRPAPVVGRAGHRKGRGLEARPLPRRGPIPRRRQSRPCPAVPRPVTARRGDPRSASSAPASWSATPWWRSCAPRS